MGTIDLSYRERKFKGSTYTTLQRRAFDMFNPSVLELGNLSTKGTITEALAAFFDLQDFTTFCNQIDPHLIVPRYVKRFLEWLFGGVAYECVSEKRGGLLYLWSPLPFFAKFVGDGVLFIWNTGSVSLINLGNIVVSLHAICNVYHNDFVPEISREVTRVPPTLRCGIARGQVISVGDNRDFVGSCINVAARIQKLPHFTFAFSSRDFDLEDCFSPTARKDYVLIKTPIRGVGEGELVFVLKSELRKLPKRVRSALLP